MEIVQSSVSAIQAALSQGRYVDIAGLCEELELAWAEALLVDPAATGSTSPSPSDQGVLRQGPLKGCFPFYSVYMFSLLLKGDTNNVRFLWKRVPPAMKMASSGGSSSAGGGNGEGNGIGDDAEAVEVAAAWEVGKAMWQRNTAQAHKALSSFDWSEDIKGLVDAVVETFRQKTIELVGRAYNTISLSELASSLGFSEDAAIKRVQAIGWRIDESQGIVFVKAKPARTDESVDIDQLKKLMNYISEME